MTYSQSVPNILDEIGKRVEERIQNLLSGEIQRWGKLNTDLVEPLEVLQKLVLAGGKRLRPAFCQLAFVGSGGDPLDPILIDTGAALELLHTFAIIHDDIMDGSLKRRGQQSVHSYFENKHISSSLQGESRRFGEGMGILVGDIAFVYSDMLISQIPASAWKIFTEMRLEVNIGQYLDILSTAQRNTDSSIAKQISIYKSGKYTVERPLHLGAALAGSLDILYKPLSEFGLALGEAFQLKDDLLGVFGEEEITGKPVGQDLREGKGTTLIALASQRANKTSQEIINKKLGSDHLTEEEIYNLQQIIINTGARQEIESQIEFLTNQAIQSLGSAPLLDEAKEELINLARYVAWRNH